MSFLTDNLIKHLQDIQSPKKKESAPKKVIMSAILFFQEGTSNKEYRLQMIEEHPDEYSVIAHFGRIGGTLRMIRKTPKPTTLDMARMIYQDVLREKRNKGYRT